MRIRHHGLLLLIMFIVAFSSCTSYRNLVYLQHKSSDTLNTYKAVPPDYHIQLRDVLFIRIVSLDQDVTQAINATSPSTGSQFNSDASFFLYGYNVSDSGYVELPVIGKVYVLNKTLDEAKKDISKQTAKYLKDATVIVKLISFKYSVLGEVNRPGVYQNFNNQLTVLEAISNAGDITDYGNRKKVMVIRPGTNGTKTFRLDLTKTNILNSDGFFLLPNDIVYVEPVRSYNFKVNIPVISLFLTSITTFILLLNYVNNNKP